MKHLPTLFTTLRQRYLNRPGGYTRVLRIESLNRNHDQAPSAILELVDGPRDMRFAMTAKTLMRERRSNGGIREITARNVAKVTRYRENGEEDLERTVRRLETMKGFRKGGEDDDDDDDDDEEEDTRDEQRPWTEREKRNKTMKRDPNSGRRIPVR